MNIKATLPTILVSAALFVATPLIAQLAHGDHPGVKGMATTSTGKLIRVTEKESAWAAKARQTYPLNVCVASDEKLGSMGDSPQYIYRVDGKPDRLVVFCCEGCEEDFMKDPAKYIAKLDAASKSKSAPGKKSAGAKFRGEQKHG